MSLIMFLIRLYIISVGGWVHQLLNLVHALANIHILKYFLSFGFTTFFFYIYICSWGRGHFYWTKKYIPKIDTILIHFIKDDRHSDKVARLIENFTFIRPRCVRRGTIVAVMTAENCPPPHNLHLKIAWNQRYDGTRK